MQYNQYGQNQMGSRTNQYGGGPNRFSGQQGPVSGGGTGGQAPPNPYLSPWTSQAPPSGGGGGAGGYGGGYTRNLGGGGGYGGGYGGGLGLSGRGSWDLWQAQQQYNQEERARDQQWAIDNPTPTTEEYMANRPTNPYLPQPWQPQQHMPSNMALNMLGGR